MAHKHKLKFIRKGVEYLGSESWAYRRTWDFACKFCPYTCRADRDAMIKFMTRKIF